MIILQVTIYKFSKFYFNGNCISVQNLLVTSKLNNQDIEKVISKLQKINNTVKVNVIVNNNVTIRNCRNLSKINSFDVEELMLKSVSIFTLLFFI